MSHNEPEWRSTVCLISFFVFVFFTLILLYLHDPNAGRKIPNEYQKHYMTELVKNISCGNDLTKQEYQVALL